MSKILDRVPRNAGLIVTLLTLPVVIGEIWLFASGHRPNIMAGWSLIAAICVLCWFFLGGSIAVSRFTIGMAQRRVLAAERPKLSESDTAEWIVDGDGTILLQSPVALDQSGDRLGHPMARVLLPRLADADGACTTILSRAARRGDATHKLPDSSMLCALRLGSGLVRLSMVEQQVVPARPLPSADYSNLPIAVLRLTDDGTIVGANPATASFCGDAIEGSHISAVLDGLGRPFDEWLSEALTAQSPPPPEVLRAPRVGQDRFIQVSLYVESAADRVLIAVLSDARALKTLEAQFVQSQKMQAVGQLAGGIAHDFNNLLTAISGHCDLLMLRHDKGDPDYADLDQISQNSNRAANLVSHLLAFSRKQTLKPQRLDLRETMADLSHLLNRLVGEKVRLSLHHDQPLDTVRADRSKIEQVIMNLVVNARDAMPDGGQIEIQTRNVEVLIDQSRGRAVVPAGRYVCVEVKDQGTGIAPDIVTKIFEPFFTTKRVGQGTGLGLSTVYGIVKQTGGYIFCESTVGLGTSFQIYLPAYLGTEIEAVDDAPEHVTIRLNPAAMTAPAEQCVLLVEDEAPVRAFASRALKMRGYQVLEAASGEEALEVLSDANLRVDLFVSDVVMPGLDGLSWVRLALQDRPGTRVIFMSGYTEDVFEDGRNAIENASFLQKPFSLSDLINTVGQRLDAVA